MINIEDLLAIIAKLQDSRQNYPWEQNQTQTLTNIAPYTIEAAYEAADAIARQDWDKFRDALGGLLSQILFYAQLAQEQKRFDLTAVVAAAKEKIIQHHSPLFGNQQMRASLSPGGDPPKTKEQYQYSSTETIGTFTGISRAQSALARAIKLQKCAAEVGFDWTSIEPVFEKIAEELGEVRAELSSTGNPDKLQGEIGDLLFACINLARHTGVDPEAAIHSCNDRFERRFRYIEYALCQRGSSLKEASLEEMDRLWEQAKSEE